METIVIERRGRAFIAYLKSLGPDNPSVGHGIAGRPQDALAAFVADQGGLIKLRSGFSDYFLEWADPAEQARWLAKHGP